MYGCGSKIIKCLHVIRCLIRSYVFRGAPGGGAAGFGGDAGATEAILANAI